MNHSEPLSPFDDGCLSYYFDGLSIGGDQETVSEDVTYAIDSDDSSCSRTACSSIFGSGPDEFESESAFYSSCSGSITKSNECLIDIDASTDSTSLNLGFLGESISMLVHNKIPLSESLKIIVLSISKINESEGPTAESLKNKMNTVLNKNSGLKTYKYIRNILCGITNEDTMELNLSPSEITAMKYAPITYCDVKRSFSRESSENGSVSFGNALKSKKNYISIKSSDCMSNRTVENEDKVAGSTALILNCRPAQIPAKPHSEQLEHERLYEQILQNAKKKESEEAKKHKKYLKQKLKNEEWLANVTRIWTQEIIPNWDQMCRTKKCHKLWWNGLPSSVRGKVWSLAIGNDLLINEALYQSCVLNSLNKFKDSEASMHCLEYIHLDITRTFPHLGIFQQGGPYFDVLKRILSAYVCLRPDIGYIQGMCFIAAILLLNLEEVETFICLVNLMESPCLNAFFTVNQRLMTSYFSTYNDLLKHNLNKLFIHFNHIGLTPEMYLVDWIYSVYAKSMNLELASIVWDNFLRDNDQFLFRAALGILRSNESQLMQMDSITCAQYLTKLPESFTSNTLLKSTATIRMSIGKQSFNNLLLYHQEKYNQNI